MLIKYRLQGASRNMTVVKDDIKAGLFNIFKSERKS